MIRVQPYLFLLQFAFDIIHVNTIIKSTLLLTIEYRNIYMENTKTAVLFLEYSFIA